MSKKVRIDKIEVVGYCFPSFPGLVLHSNKFWLDEEPVKEIYNNGSAAFVIGGVKKGKKKLLAALRKEAIKCTIVLDNRLPF